jgi:hypothetical protein
LAFATNSVIVTEFNTTKGTSIMNTADTQTLIQITFNSMKVECLYPGVRADVACRAGVAPNNPEFHAAWERMEFSPSSDFG